MFIHENPFDNVVCKMAAILSRPQCVNGDVIDDTHSLSVSAVMSSGSGAEFLVHEFGV